MKSLLLHPLLLLLSLPLVLSAQLITGSHTSLVDTDNHVAKRTFEGLSNITDAFDSTTVTQSGFIQTANIGADGSNSSFQFGYTVENDGAVAYGSLDANWGVATIAEYHALSYVVEFDLRIFDSVPDPLSGVTLANPGDAQYIGFNALFEFTFGMRNTTRIREWNDTYALDMRGQTTTQFGNPVGENGDFATDGWTRIALHHTGQIVDNGGTDTSLWEIYAGSTGSALTYWGTFLGRMPNGFNDVTSLRIGDVIGGSVGRTFGYIDNFQVGTVIPEPSYFSLVLGLGAAGILLRRRHQVRSR